MYSVQAIKGIKNNLTWMYTNRITLKEPAEFEYVLFLLFVVSAFWGSYKNNIIGR